MNQGEAQAEAGILAKDRVKPENVAGIYRLLRDRFDGFGMEQAEAQKFALQLAKAGVDKATLQSKFKVLLAGKSRSASLAERVFAESLEGRPWLRRHSSDTKLYTAEEFRQYFPTTWLSEWEAAIPEKRVARDGKAYEADEFQEFYWDTWRSAWDASPVATQMKLSPEDGKVYSMQQYLAYYGKVWQTKWGQGSDAECKECKEK